MQYVYLSLFILSLVYLVLYMRIYVKQHGIHYVVLGFLTMFTTFSYWMMSVADTSTLALRAQQGVYMGMMFFTVVLVNICCELCNIKTRFFSMASMICSCLLVLAVVTTEYTGLFYKSFELDSSTGEHIKEYGAAYYIYYFYLLCTFALVTILLIRNGRKSDVPLNTMLITSISMFILLFSVVFEKIVNSSFHFDSVGVVAVTYLFLFICKKQPLYDVKGSISETVDQRKIMGIILLDKNYRLLGYNSVIKEFMPEILKWRVDTVLPENYKYHKEFFAILKKIDEEDTVYEHVIEFGDRLLLSKVSSLIVNGKKRGYQVLIFDNTDSIKYSRLIENYNAELEKEVNRQLKMLREMENSMILGMAEMVESRDSSTGGHIKRTSEIIKLIVDDLEERKVFDVKANTYDNLIKAAVLHDLGKLAVDDAILRKPGRFTDEEFEKMKQHSARGGEIVSKVLEKDNDKDFVELSVNVAQHHHERWDGKGYPDHLAGDDIPVEARIMALADVYDALVSKRHYKESFDFEKAYNIIIEGMGTQFDPHLKETFINCVPQLEAYYNEHRED